MRKQNIYGLIGKTTPMLPDAGKYIREATHGRRGPSPFQVVDEGDPLRSQTLNPGQGAVPNLLWID
jgi:hypothetical protein